MTKGKKDSFDTDLGTETENWTIFQNLNLVINRANYIIIMFTKDV